PSAQPCPSPLEPCESVPVSTLGQKFRRARAGAHHRNNFGASIGLASQIHRTTPCSTSARPLKSAIRLPLSALHRPIGPMLVANLCGSALNFLTAPGRQLASAWGSSARRIELRQCSLSLLAARLMNRQIGGLRIGGCIIRKIFRSLLRIQ